MAKKIKDYLHLYLGCEILVISNEAPAFVDTIDAIVVEESVCLKKTGDYYFDADDNEFTIKPILRPLSDMTEEELVELFKKVSLFDLSECVFDINNDESDVWINAELKGRVIDSMRLIGDNVEMMNNDGSFAALNPVSTAILFLLSKHFDLFNLIESGLAIDKTKLKTLEE